MLEFATIPGLTKIFNRDDWQKVFLACATLPDYREKKYASYFITKDAETRAGKLYYRLTYLTRGGKKYDPISHEALVNTVADGESPYLCFGPGEKYEFANYIMCAKYEAGKRNPCTDQTFNESKEYYYQPSAGNFTKLAGYSERVVVTGDDESKTYYGRYEGWSVWQQSGTTKYQNGWNTTYNYSKVAWYQDKDDGTWKSTTITTTKSTFESAIANAKDGKIYVKITANNYTYGFTLGDKLEDKGYPIYDYEVIGDQKFVEGRTYYRKDVVGLKTNTTDTLFQSSDDKTYYIDVGGGLEEMWETDDTSELESDYTAYMVGTNIQDRIADIKAATPGMETCYIGDNKTEREWTFTALSVNVGDDITKSWLQSYANNFLYYINTANIFYTIDEDLGSLTLVTYLATGSKLCDHMFSEHTDKTFRSSRVYYVYEPWTTYKESGYAVLDSSLYTEGASIAAYEALNNVVVYQKTEDFYIVKDGFVGQITHDQDFYERAGSNYPYEGFVAVTTESGDDQSRGSLYLCRRKTYQLTEDASHGYTGDKTTGTSKSYYEYHTDTGKYVLADPVYRTPASSSFVEVTEDTTFQDSKNYYADILMAKLLVKGTKSEVEAGTADYYVASGSTPGMAVADYNGTVYDRTRTFYWRGSGTNEWVFTAISPATNRKGLTTDAYWNYDISAATPGLTKEYFFYNGSDYNFVAIDTLYSSVTDTIFGYADLTDTYYGYKKLRFGSQWKVNAGDAELVSGTTVAAYLTAHDSTAWICKETGGVFDSTHLSGDTVMKDTDDCIYHFRDFTHVSQTTSGGTASSHIYYKYDSSEKKISGKLDAITYSMIGTNIGFPVYSYFSASARPTYYYMKNPDSPAWTDKFAEFELSFDITQSTGTASQELIDKGQGYYRKGKSAYVKVSSITAGSSVDPFLSADATFQTDKCYFLRSGTAGAYTYTQATVTAGASLPSPNTTYYELYFEYSGTYIGRPIAQQSHTIYRKDYKGTIPEEIPICVNYLGDGAPEKESGSVYADGEEIPDVTTLYVISNNGENILRDEYYEECYGLYYWDQFFLDHGISANPVTDVDCFFTASPSDPWDSGSYFLWLKWKDPTIMIKKDQPTASPDEWDRTDVILHYGDKKYNLLCSRSKDMYAENYLKLNLDLTNDLPRTLDGQSLWALLERDFPDESYDWLACSLFTALRDGYIEITATSQTGMTATYYVKPKEVVWWADTEAEKASAVSITGMTSSYGYVNLASTVAIPGAVYYDITTGDECLDVYPYVSTINFSTSHKLKYDGSIPIVRIYTDPDTGAKTYTPIIIGSDVSKDTDITLPDATANFILATPCIVDGYARPNYPKVSIVELARDGRVKNMLDVGGQITIPCSTNTAATVVDFDHVLPARRVELGYTNAGNGNAVAGTTYYSPYKTTSVVTTSVSGGTYAEYKEVALTAGTALNNKFFIKTAVPHYQFYTMTHDSSTGAAVYTAIDYTGDWQSKVENPNTQIFYKDMSYGTEGSYFKYETDNGSVTLRTYNPTSFSAAYASSTGKWSTAALRTWLSNASTGFVSKITDSKFLKCVSKVFNTSRLQEYENYDLYELTSDTVFKSGKTYYTRSGSEGSYVYTVATVVVDDPVTADTYYEKTVSARVKTITLETTRDQFWVPAASNLGFTSLPDPSSTRESRTLPVPDEGTLLDAFNPYMNGSQQKPKNTSSTSNAYAAYHTTSEINVLKNNGTTALNWWLRTMPDYAFPSYVAYVEAGGTAGIRTVTSYNNVYTFAFFTIG